MNKTRSNDSSGPRGGQLSRGLRLRITTLGVLVLAFGLLLWARFLLVTSHPRTAYAEPGMQATGTPTETAHAGNPGVR